MHLHEHFVKKFTLCRVNHFMKIKAEMYNTVRVYVYEYVFSCSLESKTPADTEKPPESNLTTLPTVNETVIERATSTPRHHFPAFDKFRFESLLDHLRHAVFRDKEKFLRISLSFTNDVKFSRIKGNG